MADTADLALLDPDGSFAVRLAADRAALAALACSLPAGSCHGCDEIFGKIEVLAHRLAGAAGTFGRDAVGIAAFDLETRIAALRLRPADAAARAAADRSVANLLRMLGA